MNIRFLETVIWLAHDRNFRVTSERLHMTQPAISSRIQMIEQELGVRLFERQAREVTVTPAGEAFVAEAREIIRRYDAMMNRHRRSAELGGQVRIGLPSSMAHLLLPEITRTLRENHPGVRLEVLTDDTADKLTRLLPEKRIDICLTAHPPASHANFEVLPICTLAMVWAASPVLVPPSSDHYTPRELSRLPIISYAPGTLNAKRVAEFFGSGHTDTPHLITSNSLATSMHMAQNGIGVAMLPLALIQSPLADGSLHVLHTHPSFPPTAYSAVWIADSEGETHARAIAELTRQAARKLSTQFPADVVFIADAD
ncbi:LysR family transcriptional regulator [Hydrogenophaga sp. 2FB]|uniref:LysR family transcriptional regulator n=1 Tax=Hydrogenophaga sp. 2FB TaxID=2502187 RepID=UPI0010F693E1|nr:LysR family transcriptional regulator [Hydrogenophaga sp. 2FB]